MLDDRFFLYFEDVDLNMRARKANFRIRLVPQAKIWHKVSATTLGKLGAPKVLYYHNRNALLLARKHTPPWFRTYAFLWAALKGAKQVVKIVALPSRRPASLLIARGLFHYYSGRFGKL